jgi:hypothetical protein
MVGKPGMSRVVFNIITKMALKAFLYLHSFYSLDDYFKHNTN